MPAGIVGFESLRPRVGDTVAFPLYRCINKSFSTRKDGYCYPQNLESQQVVDSLYPRGCAHYHRKCKASGDGSLNASTRLVSVAHHRTSQDRS